MDDAYEHIIVDRVGTDNRVGRITINRPEVLNALAPQTFGELHSALLRLEADVTVRVIIVRGAGRAFSVGHDLSPDVFLRSPRDPDLAYQAEDSTGRPLPVHMVTWIRQTADIYMYFWRMAKITVVQTHGFCLAGGLEFAMMADLVTTSDDCQLGHPAHRSVGMARNGMILPLVLGMRKAKELFYTGDAVSGSEAERIGMVNHSWPAEELDERTIELADRIANQSSDFLAVLKAGANRFYEDMGIQQSVSALAMYDAALPFTESGYEWAERLHRDGLKSALAWRDGPYGDYSQSPRKVAASSGSDEA